MSNSLREPGKFPAPELADSFYEPPPEQGTTCPKEIAPATTSSAVSSVGTFLFLYMPLQAFGCKPAVACHHMVRSYVDSQACVSRQHCKQSFVASHGRAQKLQSLSSSKIRA